MNNKVNILGTEYKIELRTEKQDCKLEKIDGYCDYSIKTIVAKKYETKEWDDLQDLDFTYRRKLRHEIIHAFIYESGLWCNSYGVSSWAENEEMTDWIAIQFPKIYKVFKELNILE